MNLQNFKSIYSLVEDEYGLEPDPDTWEEMALVGWEKINNKHTRLYRYIASTEDHIIELPCNAVDIESVTITNGPKCFIEKYIDGAYYDHSEDPLHAPGVFVRYREGNGTLEFAKDYDNVVVLYHGYFADDEGLPYINERERVALASWVAYSILWRDAIKNKDQAAMAFANQVKSTRWLKECNAARMVDHLSQNDMDKILDVKLRWDRRHFHHKHFSIYE